MTVVLLCGFKGSGKDLVGDYLKKIAKENKIKCHTFAFAEKIKKTMMETFHLKTESDYDLFKRSKFTLVNENFMRELSGRDMLRSIGMAMRSCNTHVFLEDVMFKVKRYPKDLNIITDLRFDDELAWAKLNAYPIIKVVRDGSESDGHVSESGIPDDECTYIIENNGTTEELKEKVHNIFEEIVYGKQKEV